MCLSMTNDNAYFSYNKQQVVKKELINEEKLDIFETIANDYPTKIYEVRATHFQKEIQQLNLPLSIKALRMVMETMNKDNGFARHNGDNYYVHLIDVAQMAIDYQLVKNYMINGNHEKADLLVAACLLHDVIEDVIFVDYHYIEQTFNKELATIVMNVTKIKDEPYNDYVKRWSSHEISALVKTLDRMNNVTTLSESKLEHRLKQLVETKEVFLPILKHLRRKYWEYNSFYFHIRTIMNAILNEIERGCFYESKYRNY